MVFNVTCLQLIDNLCRILHKQDFLTTKSPGVVGLFMEASGSYKGGHIQGHACYSVRNILRGLLHASPQVAACS